MPRKKRNSGGISPHRHETINIDFESRMAKLLAQDRANQLDKDPNTIEHVKRIRSRHLI